MAAAVRLQIDAKTLAIMQCVDALERSEASSSCNLRQYLETVPSEHRLDALGELVRVDFERRAIRGERPSTAQYLDEYPELRETGASVVELLQSEFEMQQRAGENPSLDEFLRVHPDFKPCAAVDTNQTALVTKLFSKSDVLLAPEPEPETIPAPQRVGKYRIERQLGSGGFGAVYQAYDEQLERWVAIKIRHGRQGQRGLSADLLHEARSIAQLDHPNIVRLLEAGETPDGLGYVVYEYIDGETLDATLHREEFDHAQAVQWVAEVAEALNYAHQRRIIHRDIKPANILLDAKKRPKVVDFGLARRDDRFFQNDSGQIMGTLAYISPEQASGDSDWVSSQSDLYSLGVVLYELLCKKRPYQADGVTAMLDQVMHRSPAPPRSIDGTIPTALEEACLKAMAKQPAARFRTGNDMASAVRRAIEPKKSLLPLLARCAAAIMAIAALCVLIVSIMAPSAAVAPPSLPEISSYNLLLADTEIPVYNHVPISPAAQLKVEASFTDPAYAYLIAFEQDAAGRLIWPAEQDLPAQRAVSQLIYPPLAGEVPPLSVGDAEGATFLVVLASHERLSDRALREVLNARLMLNISPEIAARAQTCFQVAEPTPKFHSGIPTRSSEGARNATSLRVLDDFKQVLRSHADGYVGNLIPHGKVGASTPN